MVSTPVVVLVSVETDVTTIFGQDDLVELGPIDELEEELEGELVDELMEDEEGAKDEVRRTREAIHSVLALAIEERTLDGMTAPVMIDVMTVSVHVVDVYSCVAVVRTAPGRMLDSIGKMVTPEIVLHAFEVMVVR